jgi:hypothetical protein
MNDVHDALAVLCGLLAVILAVIVPILALIGSVLGYQRKIVVYDGQTDLAITCGSIVALMFSFLAFAAGPLVGCAALLLSGGLVFVSMKHSFNANTTVWNGLLAVFAKFAFLGLIIFCALVAIGGVFSTIAEAKKKRYKQAAGNAAMAAVGAIGFVSVRRLINRLVTERPPIIASTASASAGVRNATD